MSLTLDISVRSNHLSLKYETLTLSGCKDIVMGKSYFVAKTQILLEFNRSRILSTLEMCICFSKEKWIIALLWIRFKLVLVPRYLYVRHSRYRKRDPLWPTMTLLDPFWPSLTLLDPPWPSFTLLDLPWPSVHIRFTTGPCFVWLSIMNHFF